MPTTPAEQLLVEPVAATPARLGGYLPTTAGAYAWWLTDEHALTTVPSSPHPTLPLLRLVYIGIAPRNATSAATIRSRVLGDHLRGPIGSSTLRRALTAVMWGEKRWRPFTTGVKPALSDSDNASLTAWMESHMAVSWAAVGQPWRHESQLVREMRPPLNSNHNHSHPYYPTLRRLRAGLLAVARSNGQFTPPSLE